VAAEKLFRDRELLHIAGAFVDSSDFGIAIELLDGVIFRETDAAEHFDGS
jgi:hypothetical protein